MRINDPLSDDSLEDIADWLELRAFFDGAVSFLELYQLVDDNIDTDSEDIAAEDMRRDDFSTRVNDVILRRTAHLRDTYPFYINNSMLYFTTLQNEAQISYVYCLLVSHLRKDQLLEDEATHLNQQIRDYMQIVATACAAGDIQGHASAFGFPRPERETMLTKLRNLYCPDRISSGNIKAVIPSFLQHSKDAGIDVIAWSRHPDGSLNHYLLGQVATGDNWQNKSIPAEQFHQDWFTQPPHNRNPKLAIFIPILAGKDVPQNEQKSYYQSWESRLGNIFDRERIPSKVTEATKLFASGHEIERFSEYTAIIQWLTNVQHEHRGDTHHSEGPAV